MRRARRRIPTNHDHTLRGILLPPRALLIESLLSLLVLIPSCDHAPTSLDNETSTKRESNVASTGASCACGDTIFQNITLTADLLNCPGDGLRIGADGITIEGAGHRIDGLDAPETAGIRLVGRQGVTIKNCVITDFDSAIKLEGGCETDSIMSNNLTSNGEGIASRSSYSSVFQGNTIHDNHGRGIELQYDSSLNFVRDNELSNNHTGIYAVGSSAYNEISGNVIHHGLYAIWIYSGSGHSIIDGNTIYNNRYPAIILESSPVKTVYNTVSNNIIHDNQGGIKLMCSNHNTIGNNTISRSGTAIVLTDDWWDGSECKQNVIFGNALEGNFTGIDIEFAIDNTINDNMITNSTVSDIWVRMCGNSVVGNSGSGGLPIVYLENGASMTGGTVAELVVCGGSGSVIDSVTVTSGGSNGIYIIDSQDVSVRNSNSESNRFGVYMENSSGAVLSGNRFVNNVSGVRLVASPGNLIWNNVFAGGMELAHEDASSTGNIWNFGDTGNLWGDFIDNEGYPVRYVIPGDGGGIDPRPLNDEDADGYKAWQDCDDMNPRVYPGARELCNGIDDDCDLLVDELLCPGGRPVDRYRDGDSGH